MTAREIKIRQEDRSQAVDYLKKATDNYEQMLAAFNASNWNAAATLAVQCAISSADAICVHEKGVRSVSQDHLDVCDLVADLPLDGAQEKSRQLRKVVARKNLVQYECRSVHKADADEMIKVTTRVYQWVREMVAS
ncbi:MAG: HEPN domain-containing protein [Candidatus Omnitrophota bacterium]|nr:HEPN domain-containing protein [Candidatus Omnitrophota bacterium]